MCNHMKSVFKSGRGRQPRANMPSAPKRRRPSPHGTCVSRPDLVNEYNAQLQLVSLLRGVHYE